MSNPNSHNSSPSTSSADIISIRSGEMPTSGLFARAYPFAFTEEYQSTFGCDSAVQLPASYRLEYWRKNVGDPAWKHAVAEAEKVNDNAREQYRNDVQEFEECDTRYEKDFQSELHQHFRDLQVYERALIRWRADLEEEEKRAIENALKDGLRDLERALRSQRSAIADAVEQARKEVLREKSNSPEITYAGWAIFFGVITIPTPLIPFSGLISCVAHVLRSVANINARREFASKLNRYNRSNTARNQDGDERYAFWTYAGASFDKYSVYSPIHFREVELKYRRRDSDDFREEYPLGNWSHTDLDEPFTVGGVAMWLVHLFFYAMPGVGPLANWIMGPHLGEDDLRMIVHSKVTSDEAEKARFDRLALLLEEEHHRPEVIEHLRKLYRQKTPVSGEPTHPGPRPIRRQFLVRPERPSPVEPVRISPPSECFDEGDEDGEYVFKGAQVHGLRHVRTLAAARLFSDDRIRPYFMFGGVPFEISGGSPHLLIVGTSGSGKTTAMVKLMSSLLPLSKSQATEIATREDVQGIRYPRSSHEWGRSLTHQAVVYNAKGEYLQYLRAFGFEAGRDLYNLDPADPNCYAWDVASDIDSPDSVKKFAEQLVPMNTTAARDRQLEFWLGTARSVIEALIVSLRNAARRQGKKPSWTLRDLVTAVSTDETIKHILRWHDTPQQKLQSLFGLSDAQTSSIMMTLRECMENFTIVGNRWYDAQASGRSISLKRWAKEGAHSVLVLPNTKENEPTYGPLNQCVVKALSGIFLNHDLSCYVDSDGKEQTLRRYMFIDEFGQAGRLGDLERLMSEGRSFGLNVVLGLHQLSQVREAYGENGSETIIGLCSYIACLKNYDSRTQKWMSAFIGNCLRSYEKKSFSYSTSQGKTITTSSNATLGQSRGTSESQSRGTSEGTSNTHGESSSQSVAESRGRTTQGGHPPSQNSSSTDTKGVTASSSETTNQSKNEGSSTSTSEQSSTSTSTGTSDADNTTTNEGQSKTRELRGEAAIEPDEFGKFPDPETTGLCEGVYITPTLPVWRTTLTLDPMRPEYEFPERLRERSATRSHEEDELVSRSVEWSAADLERLFLDKPRLLPAVPHVLTPRQMPIQRQMEYQNVEEPSEDDPPLADFNF